MREIGFKERTETRYIYVVPLGTEPMSYEELVHKARRNGEYDGGFHFYITMEGDIVEARPEQAVASPFLENSEKSIYIVAETEQKLNDCQKVALEELVDTIKSHYANNVQVVRCTRPKLDI